MQNDLHTLPIQLFNKTWYIRCTAGNIVKLQKCATYLDSKMQEISLMSKKSPEYIAIMAAIHVVYESLEKDAYIESLSSRICELQAQIIKN